MNVLWTSEDAARATGGTAAGSRWTATGVSIDTRSLRPGDLFVALTDVRDGHDFVADALEKGAAAALVVRRPEHVSDDAPLLIVQDVLKALEALGQAGRARSSAQVIAITGSAGKTSTKDLLGAVLGKQGRTHIAEASYNNHWGVPLTLARMPANTEFAVIEIGMNHPGEIAPLAKMARPHVAIVTTVAPAHLEAFESVKDIAVEKGSIFEGLEPGGVALFNADVDTAPILNGAAMKFAARRIGFGSQGDAMLRAASINLTETASVVEGRFSGGSFVFKVGAPGRHFAMNALAVYGAALLVGADPDVVACDIGQWSAPAGRGQRERLVLDPVEAAGFDLLDDAFNANPASMAAAFEVLAAIPPQGRGRRIAILGDMLELGDEAVALHEALADAAAQANIDRVYCVGPLMKSLHAALGPEQRGDWAESAEALASKAHELVGPGDVILVKGSKGSKVSTIVDAFRKLAVPQAEGQY